MSSFEDSFMCFTKVISGSSDCTIKSRAEEVTSTQTSILIRAARLGHKDCVVYFVEQCHADIEQVGSVPYGAMYESGATALWASVVGGHIDIADYLISKGAEVNTTTNSKCTPLLAATSQRRLDLVKLLVQKGADVEISDYHGLTCLIAASSSGNEDLVKYLVDVGANVNRRRIDGKGALHVAVRYGKSKVAKMLVDRGASMDADLSGETPLLAASILGHVQIVEHIIAKDFISTLNKIIAIEALGTALLDKMQDAASAVKCWKKAMHERNIIGISINPDVDNPLHSEHFRELTTPEQLEEIQDDRAALKVHSMLLKARILGPAHRVTMEAVNNKGAELAANGEMQLCIALWMQVLEAHQMTLEALEPRRLIFLTSLTDLFSYMAFVQPLEYDIMMYFEDILHLFEKCTQEIEIGTPALERAKVSGQIVDFCYIDHIFPLVMKLLFLLTTLEPSLSPAKMHSVKLSVFKLVKLNANDSMGGTLLHYACSDVIISNLDSNLSSKFPNLKILNLLLETGADPCASDRSGYTPLHILGHLRNIPGDMLEALLAAGAHLDATNALGESFESLRASRGEKLHQIVNPVRYTSLQCLAASTIRRHGIPYKGLLHDQLARFADMH
ncbi:protein fem-1 homolog A-like [Palaemon carinicauda]|uniref:protein fem-1 homolog A-like n=1 Tax=Palaemon carinicauda TaxID=392227 RepID=UPI0035B60FD5